MEEGVTILSCKIVQAVISNKLLSVFHLHHDIIIIIERTGRFELGFLLKFATFWIMLKLSDRFLDGSTIVNMLF